MKKTSLRAFVGTSAMTALIAATPAFAAEVGVTGENFFTGADSLNENEHVIHNDATAEFHNDEEVRNLADAWTNTGNNEQELNTEAGVLETGAVDASTDWENVLNRGADLLCDENGDLLVDVGFLNEMTGAGSHNTNQLDVDNDSHLDINNVAQILNQLNVNANTGYNEQEDNVFAGDIETGDVWVDSRILNSANNTAFGLNRGDVVVTGDAVNTLTGACSDNENEIRVRNNNTVNIHNNADVDNRIDVDANTGHNQQEGNVFAGDINTGSVAVGTDIVNAVNNASGAQNLGQTTEVDVDLVNERTGAGSHNENQVDVENNNSVTVNNQADVNNELDVDANTGNNKQGCNTEGGDIVTGDVEVEFNVANQVNGN